MSLTFDNAQCPRCDGAIHRENHAVKHEPTGAKTRYVLCEYCSLMMIYSIWPDGEVIPMFVHAGKAPKHFADEKKRLEAARRSRSELAAVPG